MKVDNIGIAGIVLVSLLATGCASVPMATQDSDAQAKQFRVSSGKSRIYVYRNENIGGAMKIVITLDGKVVGSTAPKTYFALDVSPGKHDLSCVAENTAPLSVNAPSGKPVFVWQEMKMGALSARCALNLVSDADGRAGVLESYLAQTNP